MADKKLTNLRTYRKKPYFNIGNAIFGIIFIYLVITIFTYITNKHVSVYEVREGSILKDRAYTGLAIREETTVPADDGGYINYFVPEGSKVGAKTNVYTLSEKKLSFKDTKTDGQSDLSPDEQAALLLKIQSFSENSNSGHFRDVYTLQSNIMTALEGKSNQSRKAQLEEKLAQSSSLTAYPAASDGIIQYFLDGFENISTEDVTESMLSKENYTFQAMEDNAAVKPGDTIYKLVTSDIWTLVIPLSDDSAKEMAELKRVKVKFSKDGQTERANLSISGNSGQKLGFLTFHSGMIRYVQERYLDIELILEDESGLKIPKSAVINKEFYTVPQDYLTNGGNSSEAGVLVRKKGGQTEFKKVDVYFWDQNTNSIYLDPLVFDKDTVLIKPESSDTLPLKSTKSLKGVYNINKGYAVFKQIEILCESDEYYIVKSGNDYSLTNYDHIALDGNIITENSVVF